MDGGSRTYFSAFSCPLIQKRKPSRNWSMIDCIYRGSRGSSCPILPSEWAGSYLITLQKASGDIRDIAPVDIWRRVTGNAIVQATQQTAAKTCIDTYTNFKQLSLSKDYASHCLYFLNTSYSDPAFTSAEDEEDPMVIVKLDISNAFGFLRARLVLDVLAGKASRDYACRIKVDKEFETSVYGLRTYLFFSSLHTHVKPFCASTLMMGLQIT